MICHLLIRLLVFALYTHGVCAQSNITIDDTNSSIAYAPAGAWVVSSNSTLDFGGAHMLTQNPNATATFSFTGIATYFLSPKWPYTVNTQLSLDGAPPVLVDLVDHSRPNTIEGPETVQSAVVWSATGLNNTQHTLVVSVGAGQPFGIVDGIIYTVNDTTTSTTSSSSAPLPTASTSTPKITNPAVAPPIPAQADSSSKQIHVLPVVLGSLFGLIGIAVVIFALIFACRRRRRPKSETWTIEGTINTRHSGSAQSYTYTPMPIPTTTRSRDATAGYALDQTQRHGWQNTRYGHIGTPPPSMPVARPQDRAPNRYQPGETLSTITEKSTPRLGEAHAALAGTPGSAQSRELPGGCLGDRFTLVQRL
ncbi:hypothetical protein BJ912DRAFT_1023912 [Pholiota molesta]|nr:hypothetical protein BJ912DRAFT_1023912 [Pholiota molesta]